MQSYILKNDQLTLEFNELGGELTSISDTQTGIEYLWNADPKYWKRCSPILFPFVGSVKNKTYSYQGETYPSSQHGFARDMTFRMINQSSEEIWFRLDATEETKKIYPFEFRLELGYRLEERCITCYWKVMNRGKSTMYYSIGGHPGFNCPLNLDEDQSDYFIAFDTEAPIHYLQIDDTGYVNKKPFEEQKILTTDHGVIPITPHMFDNDALIIEEHQCHKVALLDSAKAPYVTVSFDTPLFGIWSPSKMNAPFICIEPWYGRCDATDFNGTLEEREYGNSLEAGETSETRYTIEIA